MLALASHCWCSGSISHGGGALVPGSSSHDACLAADELADADARVLNQTQALLPSGIVTGALPRSGALFFWHLPKTGGSTLEHFMYAQPELNCCFRGTCGACYGQCQRRGLTSAALELPTDLVSNQTLLEGNGRIFTSWHSGPDERLEGFYSTTLGPSPMLVDAAAVRASCALQQRAPCRVVMATIIRHPVEQLLSAYAYTRPPNTTLAEYAAGFSATRLLGVGGAFVDEANATARQLAVDRAERLLWSEFDVLGFTERFDATLLRLSDAFGVAHLLEMALPDNATPDKAMTPPAPAELAELAARRPELVAWYEGRLARFDDENDADAGFRVRLARLSQARHKAVAQARRGMEEDEERRRARARRTEAALAAPAQPWIRADEPTTARAAESGDDADMLHTLTFRRVALQ